jgi:hypothetical protein
MFSILSHGGDLHESLQNTHLAFAIPPLAFLCSLVCSSLLVNPFRMPPGPQETSYELPRSASSLDSL